MPVRPDPSRWYFLMGARAAAIALLTLGAVGLEAVARDAAAATLRTRVEFSAQDLQLRTEGTGTRVSLRGVRNAGGGTQPELPMAQSQFFVPDGYEVTSVRVTPVAQTRVADAVRVAPGPSGLDPSAGEHAYPRAAIATAATWPAVPGTSLGGGNLGGYRLHSVALFPVRQTVATGALTFTSAFDVELELGLKTDLDQVVRRRPSPVAEGIFRAAVERLVANPEDLPPAPAPGAADIVSRTGFAPEELPSVEGSGVDMIIVTDAAFTADFQVLADWKTKKGTPTVVRTVQWIESNYPAGHDRTERVRNFIRDAYEKWGTYLVLLAGEFDIVTPRLAWDTFFWGGRYIPTDQYFACLDGGWNDDGDHLWGEGITLSESGDNADLYPDVFVGRASVESVTEAQTFVNKSLTYDKTPPAGYVETHGALGEVLFPESWDISTDPITAITLDGKQLIQDSLDAHVPAGWVRSMRYQSDDDEDRPIAMSELNAGHHLLSIMGHGDAFKFSVGNGLNPLIQIADTDGLTNGDRLTIVVATACNPNEFDLECQGESFMNNPNGGAIAVFGPSREDFPISASAFHGNTYRQMFLHGVTQFGVFNQLGRVEFAGASQTDTGSDRWTMLTKMMMGDPELRVWTSEPESLVVAHAPSISLDTSSLGVAVTDTSGAPVGGGIVCVSDGNGTYSRVLTDAAGIALLPMSSLGTGTADVVVTAQDFRPYEGTVSVTAASGAFLVKTAETLDDDGTAPSSGNGDGIPEAGETVELTVTVDNSGVASADSAALNASVESGTSATFDFLYGGVADAAKVFVGPGRVNPGAIPFTLDFANPSIPYIGAPHYTFTPDSLFAGGPAGDEGIFVWQDSEGWHVVWGTGQTSNTVSGTISTDGRVRGAGSLTADPVLDSYAISAGEDSLTFSSTVSESHHTAGVDFALSDNTMLSLTTAGAALGNIAAAGQAAGTLVADIAAGARAGQIAYVDLDFTATAGGPWKDELRIVFAGPELEAYVFAVDDGAVPPVSGDGDGIIEVGETVRLTPTVFNRGSGGAGSVSGLVSAATGITFVDAADAYGTIGSLTETSGTDGYVFTLDDSTGTTVDLALTDDQGRTWLKTIDFVAPAATDSVWFNSTSTNIRVSWSPPDTALTMDVAGYNIYRSAVSGSGHVKQNFELLRNGASYLDTGLSLGSQFYYYVTAVDSSGNESAASAELTAWTTQVQAPGWPRYTNGFVYPGVTMSDTDGNGTGEIYIGSHDTDFYAWDFDGDLVQDYPIPTAFEIWGTAATGDLDRDGVQEVIFGGRDSRFYVINPDGTPHFGSNTYLVDLPGNGEGIRSATTVVDFDRDAELEMVFGTDIGTLYAFNADGTGVTDSTGLFYTAQPGDLTASIWGTIAIGDFDADGLREISFASFNDSLYVLDDTGAVQPGFPRGAGDDFRAGVVAGDLDNDGTMELIAGSFDNNVYVFNHDGTDYLPGGILATLPDQIGAGAALANVDADPELEIFIGCFDGTLYAFNHDGSSFLAGTGGVFAAMPATHKISAAPIIVDVDGDADYEILIGHRDGNFYGFHHDGSPLIGFPIPTADQIFSTAAAGDIDNDGDVDVAFASYDASVNVLDFSGPSTPSAYQWATFGGTNSRAAVYGEPGPYQTDAPVVTAPQYRLQLSQNTPNPFRAGTQIGFVLPRDGRVSLRVFNVSGRLVRTLVDGMRPAGPHRVLWDGRDSRGKPQSSGIYFYKLDSGERTLTRKGVLLR